jgi:hypothetical protein
MFFVTHPINAWTVLRALFLVRGRLREYPGLGAHFFYWVYAWTNIALKYKGLKLEHFGLHSVGTDFDVAKLAPVEITEEGRQIELRDGVKVAVQARFTNRALKLLVDERQHPPAPDVSGRPA